MVRVIQTLLTWYQDHHRKMPWRETNDPYKIWISEIILQQTRVQQGLPYYLRFIDKFNTVSELALADESEVLKLWQGLGYYSRARNLHKGAKIIHETYQGQFPEDFDKIIELPGVGDYTASAISAFAFNKRVVAVDGNVKRFAARWLGIGISVDKPAFLKETKVGLLELLGDYANPNLFNQAIIELGATVCTPVNPRCEDCPLQDSCIAFRENRQVELPITPQKNKPVSLKLVFFAVKQNNGWALIQRDESSVWANLYEFPNREVEDLEQGPVELFEAFVEMDPIGIKVSGYKDFKHLLSHRSIEARCWLLEASETFEMPAKWVMKNAASMGEVPVHRLMEKMMEFAGVWK